MRKRAGVSPLIAAVLLIAFTLAIGAFMSSWLQNMARTQTETASQNADAGCAYMNLNSNNATFNASGTNPPQLILTLENAGTRNAIISTIRVTGENLNSTVYSHPANFTGTLYSGDEILVGLAINTTWIDSIAKIRVIPADCPGSAINVKGSEVASYL